MDVFGNTYLLHYIKPGGKSTTYVFISIIDYYKDVTFWDNLIRTPDVPEELREYLNAPQFRLLKSATTPVFIKSTITPDTTIYGVQQKILTYCSRSDQVLVPDKTYLWTDKTHLSYRTRNRGIPPDPYNFIEPDFKAEPYKINEFITNTAVILADLYIPSNIINFTFADDYRDRLLQEYEKDINKMTQVEKNDLKYRLFEYCIRIYFPSLSRAYINTPHKTEYDAERRMIAARQELVDSFFFTIWNNIEFNDLHETKSAIVNMMLSTNVPDNFIFNAEKAFYLFEVTEQIPFMKFQDSRIADNNNIKLYLEPADGQSNNIPPFDNETIVKFYEDRIPGKSREMVIINKTYSYVSFRVAYQTIEKTKFNRWDFGNYYTVNIFENGCVEVVFATAEGRSLFITNMHQELEYVNTEIIQKLNGIQPVLREKNEQIALIDTPSLKNVIIHTMQTTKKITLNSTSVMNKTAIGHILACMGGGLDVSELVDRYDFIKSHLVYRKVSNYIDIGEKRDRYNKLLITAEYDSVYKMLNDMITSRDEGELLEVTEDIDTFTFDNMKNVGVDIFITTVGRQETFGIDFHNIRNLKQLGLMEGWMDFIFSVLFKYHESPDVRNIVKTCRNPKVAAKVVEKPTIPVPSRVFKRAIIFDDEEEDEVAAAAEVPPEPEEVHRKSARFSRVRDDDDEDEDEGSGADISAKYILKRLYGHDSDLFIKKKIKGKSSYSTSCPKVDNRQPIVLSEDEKKIMEENKHYVANDSLMEYSANGRKNYYMCPRYWCKKDNIPLTDEQLKANKMRCPICNEGILSEDNPSGNVIARDSKYFFDESKKEYRKAVPGFMEPDKHPYGQCMPCCYKREGSKNTDTLVKKCQANTVGEDEIDTKVSKNYVKVTDKFNIDAGKWHTLPSDLNRVFGQQKTTMMPVDTQHTIIKGVPGFFLRQGVEHSASDSFLHTMASVYNYSYRSTPLKYENFVEFVIDNMEPSRFEKYYRGNLVILFEDRSAQYIAPFLSWCKRHTEYLTSYGVKPDDPGLKRPSPGTIYYHIYRVYSSMGRFADYMRSTEIKLPAYFIDLFSDENPLIFKEGVNVILIQKQSNKQGDKYVFICPSQGIISGDPSKIFDKKRPLQFILNEGNTYQPIYFTANNGKELVPNPLIRLGDIKAITEMPEIYKPIKDKLESILRMYKNTCRVELPRFGVKNITHYQFRLSEIMKLDIFDPDGQIVDEYNRTLGILIEDVFIPLVPEYHPPVSDNIIYGLAAYKPVSLARTYKIHNDVNRILEQDNIIEYVVNTNNIIIGIISSMGFIVPVKHIPLDKVPAGIATTKRYTYRSNKSTTFINDVVKLYKNSTTSIYHNDAIASVATHLSRVYYKQKIDSDTNFDVLKQEFANIISKDGKYSKEIDDINENIFLLPLDRQDRMMKVFMDIYRDHSLDIYDDDAEFIRNIGRIVNFALNNPVFIEKLKMNKIDIVLDKEKYRSTRSSVIIDGYGITRVRLNKILHKIRVPQSKFTNNVEFFDTVSEIIEKCDKISVLSPYWAKSQVRNRQHYDAKLPGFTVVPSFTTVYSVWNNIAVALGEINDRESPENNGKLFKDDYIEELNKYITENKISIKPILDFWKGERTNKETNDSKINNLENLIDYIKTPTYFVSQFDLFAIAQLYRINIFLIHFKPEVNKSEYMYQYIYSPDSKCVIFQYVLPRSANEDCNININFPVIQNVLSPDKTLQIDYADLSVGFVEEEKKRVYDASSFKIQHNV